VRDFPYSLIVTLTLERQSADCFI